MGTSSILAGAVMAAVLRASGKSCDKKGLIHAVCIWKKKLGIAFQAKMISFVLDNEIIKIYLFKLAWLPFLTV